MIHYLASLHILETSKSFFHTIYSIPVLSYLLSRNSFFSWSFNSLILIFNFSLSLSLSFPLSSLQNQQHVSQNFFKEPSPGIFRFSIRIWSQTRYLGSKYVSLFILDSPILTAPTDNRVYSFNQKCSRYHCIWPHEILYRQCHQHTRYHCGTASPILLVGSWCHVGNHARLLSLYWGCYLQWYYHASFGISSWPALRLHDAEPPKGWRKWRPSILGNVYHVCCRKEFPGALQHGGIYVGRIDRESVEYPSCPLGYVGLWRWIEVADFLIQQWIYIQKLGFQWSFLSTFSTSCTLYRKSNIRRLGRKGLWLDYQDWIYRFKFQHFRRCRWIQSLYQSE